MTDFRFSSRALVCFLIIASTLTLAVPATANDEGPAIDVAIALDTSGTMGELLDAARLQLWGIVNDLAAAEPTPRLRLALLTFGSTRNDPATGWVRVEAGLTEDLDGVAERLALLSPGGGNEYVGRVVLAALDQLDWATGEGATRLIFVVGNEAADQDPSVGLDEVATEALRRGITLNMVYCGDPRNRDAVVWSNLAAASGGWFGAVDPRAGATLAASPYDAQLAELGEAMNSTFLPLGESGSEGELSLAAQDERSRAMGTAAAATRAVTKAGPHYRPDWDLVTAFERDPAVLDGLDASALPEAVRAMEPDERWAYLEDLRRQREDLQWQIRELSEERRRFIAEERQLGGPGGAASLEVAVRDAIRKQAARAGISFRDE